jgi:hypothetical protein
MAKNLNTIIPATLGVVGIEAVEPIVHASQLPLNGVVSTIMQVVIGVITLIKLFKQKRR